MLILNRDEQPNISEGERETQSNYSAVALNASESSDPKAAMRPEVRAAYERSRSRYAATYEYLKDR